ncbi:hypothetical protein ER308_06490 [Egibacter rhizosphaerae]|uniref:M23ase beta-sheet core domain-containing protein n=1 Tax=Egibacter rhizosphaerae TaxID=1670831 RepID=A0A411YDC8_9ACTN|nr:cell wall-binding repeat-containing protein [Egibacter rhizosphaerae]QBI19221.1 hypothetical protein ER308_06490 [Egibacter rhizosphaerae]
MTAQPRRAIRVGLSLALPFVLVGAVLAVSTGPAAADSTDYEQEVDLTFPLDVGEDVVSCRADNRGCIDDFHQGRSGGRHHRATDLMVPHGTPVHAAVGGEVSWLTGTDGNPPSYGYMLRIRGDDGRTYAYIHLGRQDGPAYGGASEAAYADGIEQGTRVERGELIGYAGSSGNAHPDAPHLHFEIHQDGVDDPYAGEDGSPRINPYRSLVAAEERGDRPGGDTGASDDADESGGETESEADGASDAPEPPRLAGRERIATATAIAEEFWPNGADDVVLATARDHVDAVAGGPLAASLDAPLLLTDDDAVPDATREWLADADPERIWVLGGTKAINKDVAGRAAAAADASLERLGGADRYETAEEIAALVGDAADEIVVAPGHPAPGGDPVWPAALAAGALGASGDVPAPLLLTRHDELPWATIRAVTSLDPGTVRLVAEDDVLTSAVAGRFRDDREIIDVAGGDRYTLGASAAEAAGARGAGAGLLAATGADVPDAFAAGAAAARADARLVLVPPADLGEAPAVTGFVGTLAPTELWLVGGTSALAPEVGRELLQSID